MKKILTLLLTLALLLTTTLYATEATNIYERDGKWYLEEGQHNTDTFKSYISENSLNDYGAYSLKMINDVWCVTDGVDLYMVDVDVILHYVYELDEYVYFVNSDDWAYIALYQILPIQITYDLRTYTKYGELKINKMDWSNYISNYGAI